MVNKYLYVPISDEEVENEIDIKAKDHIKGYIKLSQDRLQKCLNDLEEVGFTKNTSEQIKFLLNKLYSPLFIEKTFSIVYYLRKTILTSAIQLDADNNDESFLKKYKTDLHHIETELLITYTKIGLEVVAWLTKLGVLEDTVFNFAKVKYVFTILISYLKITRKIGATFTSRKTTSRNINY